MLLLTLGIGKTEIDKFNVFFLIIFRTSLADIL